MYITCLEESPCVRMIAFLLNSTPFRATPAESRNAWASKTGVLVCFIIRPSTDWTKVYPTCESQTVPYRTPTIEPPRALIFASFCDFSACEYAFLSLIGQTRGSA